jgi:diguanylate cyclase (GGDEF)-like protein/PAS domain S-box-containing protein
MSQAGDSPLQREVASRFESLLEHIPGMVVYLDRVQPDDPGESIPLYISPQVEQLLGYEHAAWLTDDELWLDVLHPDDRERCAAADAKARANLSSLYAEYRMIHKDGHVVWVSESANVVRDEATGILYWQGVMVDITDRKNAEIALAASERQYRSVFDAATIGLLTLELDGRVRDANPAAERALGHAPGTFAGRLLWDDDLPATAAALMDGHSDRCELELPLRRRDATLRWFRLVMVLVRDEAGSPDHLTVMLEDIDARKRTEAELIHRSNHDTLTSLPTRAYFLERLGDARERPTFSESGVGVVFIDLDNFKQVNDSAGHHAGDELLAAIAARLSSAVRPNDVVARFGGDEFVVLAHDVADAHDAVQLAWRLAGGLRAPFSVGGAELSVSASFGVCYSRDRDESPEDLVRKADAAMYTAKQRGRNRVAVFGEPTGADAVASA